MLRLFCRQSSAVGRSAARFASSTSEQATEKPWENPWKHALPPKAETFTAYEELSVDWSDVERVLPKEIIPDVPKHASYPTPSGWRPPMNPAPALPYYVSRRRDHLFPLYLERKRDLLNEKTLDFDYVELVTMKKIDGDVFACESDLRSFLEARLSHPIATHVDELKGRIKVKGVDRTDIEAFLFEKGF